MMPATKIGRLAAVKKQRLTDWGRAYRSKGSGLDQERLPEVSFNLDIYVQKETQCRLSVAISKTGPLGWP